MKLVLIIVCVVLVAVAALAAWLYTPDESRAALEARYGATAADFLPVDGLRLYVRDSGPRQAPAVILLHGFGSSLQTWDGWAAALSAHHRVIRFDLPGFGLTGADPTGDYSDRRTVQVLAALMDRLGLARAALVGNSLGGKIAWNFAATYPDRVDRLVLVSPDGFASPGFDYGKPADVPWMMSLLPYTLPKAMLRGTIVPAFGDPAALTPPLMTRYYDMMRAPGVRAAMVARMRQVRLEPPEAALHRITAPTLLVWGERDAMIPHSNAADYLRNIPTARLVSFPDLGHVPQEEAPARSVAPVMAFLDEHVK
jgi:pimeloyl-ACP methyl ester carboxylesterase